MMKRKEHKILILTYLSLFLFLIFLTSSMGDVINDPKDVSSNEIINYENNLKNLKNSGYWTLNNITIDDLLSGVGARNWTWAATQPWCSGTGTLGDPYIIENVTIKNSNTGIFIRDSTKYFVIQNVTIFNVTISGIRLNNVTNGVLFDNNISSNDIYGIYLTGSKYNLIKENFISNNTNNGILLTNLSNNNTIKENIIKNNTQHGISLEESSGNLIKGNTVNNSTVMGISIALQSNNNTISENIVNNGLWDGIYLESSVSNMVLGNNATNNSGDGIYLSGASYDTTVKENKLNLNNMGIHLMNNVNNTIKDNTINNSTYDGIFLVNCDFTKILGNLVNNNKDNGMSLVNSTNNFLEDNFINNNQGDGILLMSSSHNNTIKANRIIDSNVGIDTADSDGNAIIENTVNGSLYSGISVYLGNFIKVIGNIVYNNTQDGIYTDSIYNSTIAENTVYNNLRHGIYLTEENINNNVTRNIISDNAMNGIDLSSIFNIDNLIWKNILIRNGKHAMDAGSNNNWNSTTIGNYWDNHTGPDTTPNDGIVDAQYNISGPAGSIDYLPIADDGAPRITINTPSGGDAFGSSAPSFDVTIIDNFLDEMWYSVDGGLNNYTFTTNGIIEQAAWGAISDGALTLAFYARDILGNIGSADVIIEKDTQAPIITINSPNPGEIFSNDAPSYNVTVTDPNLDSVWLELDGSNYELSIPIIGTINQTAWAALPEGSYTITLHANDTLGHSTSEAVTITKIVPSGGGIGLDYFMTSFLIFITGGIGVIVIIAKIYTKRRVKSS